MRELILENLSLLKELAGRFKTYQNASIDLKRLIYFITQFEDVAQAKAVIELLKNIDFIDSDKMTYLLTKAYYKIEKQLLDRPLICPLGSIQDSSALVCNKLIKTLFENEKSSLNCTTELSNIGLELLKKPSCIVFFDDNITSGTQVVQFFAELIEGDANAEIVKVKLNPEQLNLLKTTPIRLCFAVQLSSACDSKVLDIQEKYGIDIKILVGKTDLNNHLDYGSSSFSTFHEAETVKGFVMAISEQLYKNKTWTKETLYSRLLGYGNLGKLTVFYHNIPKSLLPIFWKFGSYKNNPWIPLFPENKEAIEMKNGSVEMDHMRLELFDHWLTSVVSDRKPMLVFGFLENNEIVTTLNIPIPTEERIAELYQPYINPKKLAPGENHISSRKMIFSNFPTPNLNDQLSEREYQNYLAAVENYNTSLNIYQKAVEDYVRWFISSGETLFVIRNEGTKSATNVKVELSFDTGNIIVTNFESLTKPEFKDCEPKLTDFQYGAARIISTPFELPEIIFSAKSEPIELNNTYLIKKIWNRVGHNDEESIPLEIHKIDESKFVFELHYQINFDEEPDTMSGVLTINFEQSQTWYPADEHNKKTIKLIDNFFKDLTREASPVRKK